VKFTKLMMGFYLGFSTLLSTTQTFADENPKMIEEKIYVTPNQIVLTEGLILAYLPGSPHPVSGTAIAFDSTGLYMSRMVDQKGPCYLHDLWCNRCGGCGVLLCPMNCSCYD
jgi:hypothetical protein